MSKIHFLNVREGDCSVIQHNSGRITVIDVCNAADPTSSLLKASTSGANSLQARVLGNFNQKKYPVNPIQYLSDHGIASIFRYIQTHPDMDHMDGLKALNDSYSPLNFWDTENDKEIDAFSWLASSYRKEDWDFYKSIRDNKPQDNPKRIVNLAGDRGQYWNKGKDSGSGGDGIHILAPTQKLVDEANSTEDYNQCSYVLLYRTNDHRIVFGGDSHDTTWKHILDNYRDDVTNIDLLIG